MMAPRHIARVAAVPYGRVMTASSSNRVQPFGVAIVTGANSGLGFETARDLAVLSPAGTVILACRDEAKGAAAAKRVVDSTGNAHVRAMRLDVSSMSSVRDFAAECREILPAPIDALVCNAGISRGPSATADGLDPVFTTNHLGHFLLTRLLLDRLSPVGRILSVSSDMHSPPGPRLRWPGADAVAHGSGTWQRYSYSKLSNLYFVYELSRRLREDGSGISVAAFNPGLMTETNFASMPSAAGAVLRRVIASRVGRLETSAAALARLAAGTAGISIDGRYFDRTDVVWARSSELSYSRANAADLWRVSSALTGVED